MNTFEELADDDRCYTKLSIVARLACIYFLIDGSNIKFLSICQDCSVFETCFETVGKIWKLFFFLSFITFRNKKPFWPEKLYQFNFSVCFKTSTEVHHIVSRKTMSLKTSERREF